ncbi:NADH:flavin oxidoreductase [Mycolicibacterium smegmatis]|uniref:NADH:flavin oxidoreductase/nadh oxidase n=2 Tax=Mycolicibacterium smegmatis (strain ATCC 700084 / mc(2)155) TaxID=246196 RepID=A0QWK0_MYCS2|nr:NADH:flavin oxidoreductase [Mycolicibacterium smegmatis]ABK73523.1 NADH:flavin oxidoreductase/nadh oxidase [Mycolicibacterium smegmatis MC2 155]AFP39359.1 NADH:flavin oxidoreductase/NADH oxidase [Mycolicibacterium smegmatis MC2 155]AIU08126.1 NADH:flavin oxidoreductase [Mycolicibacterium smegmatis MC2 155]AIU14751.1 NADH:flavin oxidoreductase [Mycolicibacterium smegmatis]AIU21374.1 NADH:flavin oxidoreductase [Mycolicibacterium smegmatis]
MTNTHPALTSVRLGGLKLDNRFAVAPMTRVSATADGAPTDAMAGYYAEFARGGFGLVITEGTYTDTTHSQGYLNQPGLATDAHAAGWRPVTDAVHAAGVPIVAQLMHAGALSQGNSHGVETIAPSAVAPRGTMLEEYGGAGTWPTPREMSAADIDAAIAGFVDAAVRARAAGFDGVEIHAANGYLLDQFLTTYTNHRTDEYGGTVAHRIRLAAQISAAVRTAVGADFLVGVRLSQTKVNDFEYRWPGGAQDAEVIFTALAATGIDYLHIASEGRDFIDGARLDDGRTITALARQVTGLPVIANGGMHDTTQAAGVLDGGHADVLSIGRGALANPDLPQRVSSGAPLERFDHGMLSPMATIVNAAAWTAARHRERVPR